MLDEWAGDAQWRHVFGEVCIRDYYQMRSLPFVPDVIFDLGANVGAFTTMARVLFPNARIVSVEPHPETYSKLIETCGHFPCIRFVNKAIGTGDVVWHAKRQITPPYYAALCSYVTPGQVGFSEGEMTSPAGQPGRDDHPPYSESCVEVIRFDALMSGFVEPDNLVLVKSDCEGGENCIFTDEPSMQALRRVDCITMEIHDYAKGIGTVQEEAAKVIRDGLLSLSDTHSLSLNEETRHFFAIRKELI